MPDTPTVAAASLRVALVLLVLLAAVPCLLKLLFFPAWSWWWCTLSLWGPWAACCFLGLWVVLHAAFKPRRA